jgi:hypothetical protein
VGPGVDVTFPASVQGERAGWWWDTVQARGVGVSAADVDAHFVPSIQRDWKLGTIAA